MAIGKIFVAHDFTDAANRALAFAGALALQIGAGLVLGYVHDDTEDGRGPAPVWPAPLARQLADYRMFLERELDSIARKVVDSKIVVTCRVSAGVSAQTLETMALDSGADLICLAATSKSSIVRALLGSTSLTVLRSSPLPVLLVP